MHSFRASRFMRVMALFAWLMLMVTSSPVVAMGSGMASGDMPVNMAAMMGHTAPASSHHGQDCCGGPTHADCHCDAMCGGMLVPALPILSGSPAPAERYAVLYGIDAPMPDPNPPLRPPAA
jgi:hypothetical protein